MSVKLRLGGSTVALSLDVPKSRVGAKHQLSRPIL
jgi:hypothetical protein